MPRMTLTSLDRLPAGAEALVEAISAGGVSDARAYPLGLGHGRGRDRGRARARWDAPGRQRRHRAAEAVRGEPAFKSALAERLAALGFVPGARLAVQSNHGRGPVIVSIRGARVAVGRGQAHRILVRPAGPGTPDKSDRPVTGE